MSKEAKARIRINELLQRSRWRFFDDATGPANIALEANVKLTKKKLADFGDDFEHAANGFIDYLLLDVRKSDRFYFKDGNIIWLKKKSETETRFVEYSFQTEFLRKQIDDSAGATVGTFTIVRAKNTLIPLPPVSIQRQIVAELEAERALVDSNRELIGRFEQKLQAKLAEIWGEAAEATA